MNLSRQYILVVLERFEEFRQDYSPKPLTNPDLMDVEYKLHAAKQHRFLFLKSQGFNKPITHLKYKKKKDFAYTDDYKYKIPITSFLRTNPVSDAICETPSTSSTIKTQTNDQSTPTDTPLVFTGKATDYYTSDGDKEWYAELTRRESSNINKVQQTNSLGTSVKKLDQERINVSRDSNEHHVYLLTSYFTKRKKATTDSDKLKELNSQYEEFQLAHPILFNTKDAQNNDASTSL
ncbi:hypothetical protein GLOIN_2v1841574 [Rhizophagus irregularis DAOM 181602=DAOM 197198]|nr:hypothetical protein GLOIN_2v1841574 [Rhizophagus irregularis DAOM 181602=DAOM 197198]